MIIYLNDLLSFVLIQCYFVLLLNEIFIIEKEGTIIKTFKKGLCLLLAFIISFSSILPTNANTLYTQNIVESTTQENITEPEITDEQTDDSSNELSDNQNKEDSLEGDSNSNDDLDEDPSDDDTTKKENEDHDTVKIDDNASAESIENHESIIWDDGCGRLHNYKTKTFWIRNTGPDTIFELQQYKDVGNVYVGSYGKYHNSNGKILWNEGGTVEWIRYPQGDGDYDYKIIMSNIDITHNTPYISLTTSSSGWAPTGWSVGNLGSTGVSPGGGSAKPQNPDSWNGNTAFIYVGYSFGYDEITIKWRSLDHTYTFSGDSGSSNYPGAHTKREGVDFTFPTSPTPVWTGHKFLGWAANIWEQDGRRLPETGYYKPGQTVNGLPDCNVLWWAQWEPWKHTVKYDLNGGSGTFNSQLKTWGVAMSLHNSTPTRAGYTFTGWKDSHGNSWKPGQNYDHDYDGGTNTMTAQWTPNNYTVDLNGTLDGTRVWWLDGIATADIYINGKLVANDVSDYGGKHAYGSSYKLTDIKAKPGYTYTGGDITGTIWGDVDLNPVFKTSTYSNTISHWVGGFENQEGNNNWKNMFFLENTSFIATYGASYTMDSSRSVRIPNGFELNKTFGSSSIDGSWKDYAMGTKVTQKSSVMNYEYDYIPISYKINYNLDGGINDKGNPTSYNVLYGVTLKAPSRNGYTFVGWKDSSSGKIITGINEGANAKFSSASDLYDKLSTRKTGNITLTAQWFNYDPGDVDIVIPTDPPGINSNIPPFMDGDNLVIQLGDEFNPLDYVKADDPEDGDISDRIVVKKNPIVYEEDGKTTKKAGKYEVVYSVTDMIGATTETTITVIVNDPPKIEAEERWFFKDAEIDSAELLRKVKATDKEDGTITDKVKIKSIKYTDENIIENPDKLDTSTTGVFEIEYEVTDKYKKTVTQTALIHVVDDQLVEKDENPKYVRYISKEYINTLDTKSVWRTAEYSGAYNNLQSSLNKESENEAIMIVEYSNETVQNAKEYIEAHAPSTESNTDFYQQFINSARSK